MSDNDEFGAFLVGFIMGGLAGAVAALLLAPQSGEETRAIIKERSIELRDQASADAEEAWKRAEEAAKQARARAEEATKQARARAEELAQQARSQGEEISLKARAKGKELVEGAKKIASRKKAEIEAPAEASGAE